MSNVIKHSFFSQKADLADTTKIRPSNWNAEHAFSGGAHGSLLMRDTGQSDGASWTTAPTLTSLTISGPGTGATFTNLSTNFITLSGPFQASQLQVAGNQYIGLLTRGWFSGIADGKLLIENAGLTSGLGVDLNTDGTFKLRNRAHTADAQLSAASVRGNVVAFASVPATPVEGMCVAINDSNTAVWGATIAGGGANRVLAYYNGTNWTVAGK